MYMTLGIALILLAAVPVRNDEGAITDFLEKLMDSSVYNKKERPFINDDKPVIVDIDAYVDSISAISEITMDYSINIFLRQRWRDPRLSFTNNNSYNNTVTLHYDMRKKMWLPDLFIRNEQVEGSFHDITVPNVLLTLTPTGDILFSQRLSSKLSCHMFLQNFPMDKQECQMQLESYGHTTKDIIFRWRSVAYPVQVNQEMQLPEFNLSKVTTDGCTVEFVTGTFTCIYAQFDLERQFQYYLIQVYVPSVLIVILSWVSFWIDIHAVPARVSLGLLTVLTITTQASGISAKLPRVSYVKAIDVWMFVNILFVFGALIEYSVVNVLARTHKVKLDALNTKKNDQTTDSENNGNENGVVQPEQINLEQCNGNHLYKRTHDKQNTPTPKDTVILTRQVSSDSLTKEAMKMSLCQKILFNRALMADVVSRVLFPGTYIFFNIFYWIFYMSSPDHGHKT